MSDDILEKIDYTSYNSESKGIKKCIKETLSFLKAESSTGVTTEDFSNTRCSWNTRMGKSKELNKRSR